MPSKRKKKVAYLFGAGATHAELLALSPDLIPETDGLLISNVSPRVIKEASTDANYTRGLETVSSTSGQLKNIELLISLIENAKTSGNCLFIHDRSHLRGWKFLLVEFS